MEPMALGSPVGSPSSPGFLPAFLMGETTHNPHPSSPTKHQHGLRSLSTPMPTTPRFNLNSLSPIVESPTSARIHVNPVDKPGGPPVKGLFDTLESVTVPKIQSTPGGGVGGNLNASTFTQTCTPNSAMGRELVGASADNWVTVFGFPPASASMILNQFSQLGQLLEHRFPPKGNWVHLHYYSKMEARRALTYHGRVLGGTIMIAVAPCQHPDGVVEKEDGVPQSPLPSSLASRVASPGGDLGASCWTPNGSVLQSPRARPLSRTFHSNEVLSAHNTPMRNNNIVSRTIDYFFGW